MFLSNSSRFDSPGRGAEHLLERPGVEHGPHHLLEQRSGGNQVRRAPLDQLDDDLGRDHVADLVVLERLDRMIRERILIDDLQPDVEQQRPDHGEDRADDGERNAPGVPPVADRPPALRPCAASMPVAGM